MLLRSERARGSRVVFLIGILCATARAQEPTKRFEAGAHVAILASSFNQGSTLGPVIQDPECAQKSMGLSVSRCNLPSVITYPFKSAAVGFGGHFGLSLTEKVGLEGEVRYFPNLADAQLGEKRPALEVLAGMRTGWRGARTGFFGKVRPALLRFESSTCRGSFTSDSPPCPTPKVGVDLGGIVEFYTHQNIVIRFDVGDMLIVSNPDGPENDVRHNLEVSAGIGFRF